MSPLTTDNRDMVEIETELRARIDAQRDAIERLERENAMLRNLLGGPAGDFCPDEGRGLDLLTAAFC